MYTLVSDVTIILSCVPVDATWNFALMATAKCFPINTFTGLGVANSVVTIATDLLLALLPIPIVWKLHASMRTKIALMAVLALGLMYVSASHKPPKLAKLHPALALQAQSRSTTSSHSCHSRTATCKSTPLSG